MTRGGAGMGQGRKALPTGEAAKPRSVRPNEIKTLRLVNSTFALHISRMEQQLQERNADAARYAWLRDRDLESINLGGLFVGRTPDNIVLNGDDLDAAIDERLSAEQMAPRQQATHCGECHLRPGERCDICGAYSDVR